MPPLPAVSIPWSTSSRLRPSPSRLSANSRSWSAASSSAPTRSALRPAALPPENPGVEAGSTVYREKPGPTGVTRVMAPQNHGGTPSRHPASGGAVVRERERPPTSEAGGGRAPRRGGSAPLFFPRAGGGGGLGGGGG